MNKVLSLGWLLLLLLAFSGCGGSSSGIDGDLANNANRSPLATQANPFVTELVAGAGGWNNGGWPDHGTDVGSVSVWNDGTNIHVTYDTDGVFYFGGDAGDNNLHLWIGEDGLPGVAPGQLPWGAEVTANGTTYEFTIPLVGNYPSGGYMDGAAYNWGSGDGIEIAAHAVTCYIDNSGGGGGGGTMPEQGVFATKGLYYGSEDVYAGDVIFSMDGWDLVVSVVPSSGWYLHETQLWVDFTEPPFAAGQWPYKHSPLPDWTVTDEYRISLFEIGAECEDDLLVALHATLYQDIVDGEYGWYDDEGGWNAAESATTWDDCRYPLVNPKNGKPHKWKSYTCLTIPPCGGTTEPGDEVCETAWGFDLDGARPNGDGISRNEDGWFPNYFGGPANNPNIKRWGWVFDYSVE